MLLCASFLWRTGHLRGCALLEKPSVDPHTRLFLAQQFPYDYSLMVPRLAHGNDTERAACMGRKRKE